jgi:putative inorganic carbon (HCO3(-)) transporter
MQREGNSSAKDAPVRWATRALDILGLALTCALVIAVPIVFSRTTVEAGRVKLLIVELAALGLGVLWLARRLEGGSSATWRSPLTLPVLALAIANLLSLALSSFPAASAREVWRVGVFLLLFLSVQDFARRPWARVAILAAFLATAAAVAVYGWGQKLGFDAVHWSSDPAHRVFSTIGNPNMLAGYLVMAALVAAATFAAVRRWWLRALLGLLLIILLPCLFWTKTRASWLGFLAGLFLLVLLLWRSGYFAFLRRNKPLALIGGGLAVLLLLNAAVYLYKPIASRFATAGMAARVRMTMWKGAWGMFLDRPVLGHGPGSFQVVFPRYRPTSFREPERRISYNTLHAHNELLETAAELGLVGLGCFAWFLIVLFREVWRVASGGLQHALVLSGIGAGAAGLLVQNLAGVAYRWIVCPTVFWVLIGIAGAVLAGRREEGAEAATEATPRLRWPQRLAANLLALGAAAMLFLTVSQRTYRSQQLLRSGSAFTDRGVWSEAIDRFRESVRLDPLEYRSYYKLAYCYCETGNYTKALETYRDLQCYAPDFAQVHYNLGFVYSCLKQWDKASEEFLLASKMRVMPEEINYGPILSRLQAKLKDKEKTLAVLTQIAESSPADKLAQNRVGIFHYREGNLDEASRWFARALNVDGRYVAALNNLAGIQYRRKDYKAAIASCQRVLAIDPKAIKPRINLGRAYYMVGDRRRATEEWRAVVRIDPRNSEALACLKSFGAPKGTPPRPQEPGKAKAAPARKKGESKSS